MTYSGQEGDSHVYCCEHDVVDAQMHVARKSDNTEEGNLVILRRSPRGQGQGQLGGCNFRFFCMSLF